MSVAITLGIFFVVAILYAVLCTKYRERWCAREGFEDLGKVSDEWYQRLRGLQDRFGDGDVGHVGSALRRVVDGRTLWLLEHEWRTGSINSRRAHWKTFVIWELDESEPLAFSLRRKSPIVEQALATVARAIVFVPHLLFLRPLGAPALEVVERTVDRDDSDLSEAFTRLYDVTGDSEAVRRIFTRGVQDSLCDQPLTGELVAADRLLLWQAPGLLAPWNLDEKLTTALRLRQLLLR